MKQRTGPPTPARAPRARRLPAGFGLLEVIVALAVLTIATLGTVQLLAAGVAHTGRSLRLRRALEMAELTVTQLRPGDPASSRWEQVEVDLDADGGRLPCRRRIDDVAAGDRTWFVVRAECGEEGDAILARLQVLR